MLTADVYLTRPTNVEIATAAQSSWGKVEQQRGEGALNDVIDAHVEHVRQFIDMLDPQVGAVLVTDIVNTDLAVVDAHFPAAGERFVSVFTRSGATLVIHMLNRVPPVRMD